MRLLARALIRLYRYCIAPLLGARCRFYPSCSAYALEAFERHPFHRAFVFSAKRIARCHPWHPGGVDAVPPSMTDQRGVTR